MSNAKHNVVFYRIVLTTGHLQVLTETLRACIQSNDIWDPMRLLNLMWMLRNDVNSWYNNQKCFFSQYAGQKLVEQGNQTKDTGVISNHGDLKPGLTHL